MNIDAVVFPLSVNGIPDDNKRVDVKEAFPSPSREGNERDGPIAFALMRRGWPPFRVEKEKENWILVTIWINYVSLILCSSFNFLLDSPFLEFFPPSMMRFSVEKENRASINRRVVQDE